MSQNPMLQPDSYGTPSSWDEKSREKSDGKSGAEKSSAHVGDVVSAGDPRDVAEVARALAAHGGGEASFELALDLVLHEVVEQARRATGATGAAIALARAGEMVCRATSGPDAPDLGVRLETTSGLSGACLQTGTIQLCGDTETDSRVDAEACRRLGVRSILVLPLGEGPEPFGILEVFSSLLDAFGDHDVSSLRNLARRVVANNVASSVENRVSSNVANSLGSDLVAPFLPSVEEKSLAPGIEPAIVPEIIPEIEQNTPPDQEPVAEIAGAPPGDEAFRKGHDLWTTILGVLVILTAIVLGLALGWRGALIRGFNGISNGGSPARPTASSAEKADHGTDSGGEEASGAPASDSETLAKSDSQPQQGSSKAAPPVEPPSGGLVVTQNGKVIYRFAPGQPTSEKGATGSSETGKAQQRAGADGDSRTRLIHRVEPQYPEEARTQHIQGSVTLDVQIGREGAVHNIAVVEGNSLLAEAAVQAVRQWRYQPYSVDGRPVEMETRITIRFTLPPA
jgi:TonB family protein